jgi:hypothetical protein
LLAELTKVKGHLGVDDETAEQGVEADEAWHDWSFAA